MLLRSVWTTLHAGLRDLVLISQQNMVCTGAAVAEPMLMGHAFCAALWDHISAQYAQHDTVHREGQMSILTIAGISNSRCTRTCVKDVTWGEQG